MNTTHSSNLPPEVPGYVELQRQVHEALRAQHPEWILPNGEAPTCDCYDARFAQLLTQLRSEATRKVAHTNVVSSRVQFGTHNCANEVCPRR